MRFLLLLLLSVGIALGIGGWTAKRALDAGSQDVRIAAWTVDPLTGSSDAGPYEKARLSRTGDLTLGVGEGVRFRAVRDAGGMPLRLDCRYRLTGEPPPARAWTLAAFTTDGRLIQPGSGRPGWLVSRNLMRADNNAVTIDLGASAAPGNWLALAGQGNFVLALTLYDTPASSQSGLGQIGLPLITRTGCNDV